MVFEDKNKGNSEDSDIFRKTIDMIQDVFKKALLLGNVGVFLSEDSTHKILTDLKVPTDMINYIIQQSNKSKNELIRIISDEVKNLIRQAQIDKLLSAFKINIKMEVSFDPRDNEKLLDIKANVDKKDDKK